MDVTTFGNWSLTYVQVTGSSIDGPLSALLYGGTTGVGDEEVQDAEGFGAPGIVFRPRPPEDVDTDAGPQNVQAEAIGARRGDEVFPLAWRDLRFHKVYPAPKAGTVALVGYGGGFITFEDVEVGGRKVTNSIWYIPYDFSGAGIPQKAHMIALSPESESINILQGDGAQVVLLPDKEVMAISDNDTWWKLAPGRFDVQAAQISLIGTVYVGGIPPAVVPLAKSDLSPATRVFGM